MVLIVFFQKRMITLMASYCIHVNGKPNTLQQYLNYYNIIYLCIVYTIKI